MICIQLCAVEVDCNRGAVMAATLANGGYCPVTENKVCTCLYNIKYQAKTMRVYGIRTCIYCIIIASFPGLPTVQFLIACSMQKQNLYTASDQKLEPGKVWE